MSEPIETSSSNTIAGALKSQVLALQNYSLLVVESIGKIFTHPRYIVDTFEQMDVIGVGSLPIILLAGIFIGGVTVLQTAAQFERFGEKALTGDAVALALVRELGPVITALLVSGRNASGIASELGSMVVTEQVDAMRALGTDPIRKLIGPRIVATVLMLPLLTALFDFIGLVGGFIVAHMTLGLGVTEFWTRAIQALEGGDLVQGISKPLVFGFILSTVACYQGLKVRGGTQGVGRATTTAVVISCISVLIVDFFMSRILLYIYRI
ncbi:MAG: MlaE family ABC transporter permease [Candidatus Acidiferrales bacterium]